MQIFTPHVARSAIRDAMNVVLAGPSRVGLLISEATFERKFMNDGNC